MHQARAGDGESRPLISSEAPEDVFSQALGIELEKICSFYVAKEGELFDEVSQLLGDIGNHTPEDDDVAPLQRIPSESHRPNRRLSSSNGNLSDDDVEDSASEDDETTGLTRPRKNSLNRRRTAPNPAHSTGDLAGSSEFGRSIRRHSTTMDDFGDQSIMFSSGLYSSGIMLKKRIISLYVQLSELKSYVQLNKTGFRKVLKKFDKILDKELKSDYMKTHIDTAYPFNDDTKEGVEEKIAKMETAYADIVTAGDLELAKKDLRSHLREHVVWERNTVWRDLIGIERRAEAASLGRSLLGQGQTVAPLQGDERQGVASKKINTPIGRFSLPLWLFNGSMLMLLLSIVVFFLLLFIPIMEMPEQQNCLALLVFVSLLWATEVSRVPSGFAAISDLSDADNSSTDYSSICYLPAGPLSVSRPERSP